MRISMKGISLFAASLVAFLGSSTLLGQSPNSKMPEKIERKIDRVMNGLLPETGIRNRYAPKVSLEEQMAHYHTPGASIAIIKDYKIEWARGFGVKEWGKRDPVTETTLFQAGSISKPIFAVAVMCLVQEGKLDLDEDVNHYLTSWKVPPSGNWQPRVTFRQILSHSAGFTVHGFPGYVRSAKLPTLVDILNGQPPSNTARIEVNILPGVQLRYSGGGITAAQQLVVDVLGQPFPRIMRELVLDPLNMEHSTYEQPLPVKWEGLAATAHPFNNNPVEGKWHVYPEMAAAGLWTTPSDLARAGIELQLALRGESNRVLSAEKVRQMLTPGIDEEIGIGFFLSGEGKTNRFGHNGADEGFVAQMTVYKDTGLGAVVMLNSNEGFPMLNEIERAIAREYEWPGYFPEDKETMKVPPEVLKTYVGEYTGKSGFHCTVTIEKGSLFLKTAGQSPIELRPETEQKFGLTGLNAEISFERTDKGEVKSLILQQEGKQTLAERQR
jgi:CubicO group peptidase (beta-lactamase class C family)